MSRLQAAGLAVVLVCAGVVCAQGAARPEDLVKQGTDLEKSGRWQDAKADYLGALAQKPKYGEALFRIGGINLDHDSAQVAVKQLESALYYRYDPNKVEPVLALAYFRTGVFSSAIETYQKVIDRRPNDASLHVGLAEVYYANGSDDEAHDQDSLALQLDAKSLAARMLHGRLHSRSHEFDVARGEYRKVLAADPNYVDAYEALAELFKSSQPDSAVYYYHQYLTRKPDDATVNFSLSGLYYQLSQKDLSGIPPPANPADTAAMKLYLYRRDSANAVPHAAYSESAFVYVGKAIQLGYAREDIYDFYVKVAVAANKRAASITALQTVLQNNPKDAQRWALLGAVYSEDTADINHAIDSYRNACGLDSMMRRRCYAWIAAQFLKQKQYDSAITYYTKVITIDPKSVSAYMNRAYAYGPGKDDWPSALADVHTAISTDTLNTFPRVFLMNYDYTEKKYDAAYNEAKLILKIDPSNAKARTVKENIDAMRAAIKKAQEEQ